MYLVLTKETKRKKKRPGMAQFKSDNKTLIRPGTYPIKILLRKFYAMLIFKNPDWLINLSSQSECVKN